MIKGSINDLTKNCFRELSDKDAKRVLAVATMLEKKYANPNINKTELIIETYVAIRSENRKYNNSCEYIEFIINSMRSIAHNEITRAHNKHHNFDNDSLEILPCDQDSIEERLNKESEIKAILKALSEHDSLVEMAKNIFIDEITNMSELSKKLGISIDQAKYLKKKMILLAKNNISKTSQK